MNIVVKADGLSETIARFRGLADRQINAATVAALNDAAFAGYKESSEEIARVFDRPTEWIKRSVRYVKARKDKLESSIDFDQWGNKTTVTAGHVLSAQIKGGARKNKRSEVALQRAGVLPAGMAIVPGPAARMDQYGNMQTAQIVQIISWFQGFEMWSGARQNMTDKTKMKIASGRKSKGVRQRGFEYFAVGKRSGKLSPGIYLRKDYNADEMKRVGHLQQGGAAAVMFFVKMPQYGKRFDFYKIAEAAAQKQFQKSFDKYLAQMLRERGL